MAWLDSQQERYKLYAVLLRIAETYGNLAIVRLNANNMSRMGGVFREFGIAMNDDFNTAKGLAVLFEAVRNLNRLMDSETEENAFEVRGSIEVLASDIVRITNMLGILSEIPAEYFEKKKNNAISETSIDAEKIEKMIQERTDARKSKDFATADRIRKELDDMNISIEDKAEGTVWKII